MGWFEIELLRREAFGERRAKGLKKSRWRCRMLNTGGIQARSFYRRIGT
jgi:hypothetical protein